MNAIDLFDDALKWLANRYNEYKFFTERDIAWTLQNHLADEIAGKNLPYKVYNDWPILPGPKRSYCADLVIKTNAHIELAVELKYEPDHKRQEFSKGKLNPSRVCWGLKSGTTSVEADMGKANKYVSEHVAKTAYAIFIDEGRWFQKKKRYAERPWIHWGDVKPYPVQNREKETGQACLLGIG